MYSYPLIALLGADGVGKSSVASALARRLGATTVKTPGPAYDGLRKAAERLTPTGRFQFYSAAVAMSEPRITDCLRTNPVIVDRYLQCTVAFHSAMEVEIPYALATSLALPEPTLSVHLTVGRQEARSRIAKRITGSDSRPDEVIETNEPLQLQVIENYRALESFGFSGGFLPVEIATDGKTPDQVAAEIEALL